MTSPAAFRAVYADWKLIKTRGQVQIVLELPIEQADAAYEVLGGMPQPSKERWFAIAALSSPQDSKPASERPQAVVLDKPQSGGKRSWNDLPPAQQAGIRCEEPMFIAFLKEERATDWRETSTSADERNRAAESVRLACGVPSRSELNTNQKARVIWHQLNDQYEAWMRVGA
jgi:hypothetical protein